MIELLGNKRILLLDTYVAFAAESMGCVNSRADINDLQPNIFQVMNVDDLGNLITPGRLEVTESDIVLYQRGKQAVKWPLRCLRRYGYDSEIFSFESGRRCSTGPGIYAFKCRRADQLFNLVQTNIQDCNNSGEDAISRDLSLPLHTSSTISRMTIPTEPNYLDPTPMRSTNRANMCARLSHSHPNGFGRLSSVGSSSGPISPQGTVPSPPPMSPMTLPPPPLPPPSPPPPPCSLSLSPSSSSSPTFQSPKPSQTNTYNSPSQALYVNEQVLSAITMELEYNNNKSLKRTMHKSYTMSATSSGLMTDSIGMISQSIHECLHDHKPPPLPNVAYMNVDLTNDQSPLSPVHGAVCTLLGDETYGSDTPIDHAYINISPGIDNIEASTLAYSSMNNRPAPTPPVATPTHLNLQAEGYMWDERNDNSRHCYANLEPSEIDNLRIKISGMNQVDKSPVLSMCSSATTISTNNAGDVIKEVNYAVLDLDKNSVSVMVTGDNASGSVVLPEPPESPSKVQKGYATIDFNKTAALSHSVNPNGVNDNEGSRKTRHNSTINDLASPRQNSSISE